MNVKVTIRDVRKEVRDELAARASARGLSLQKFLLAEFKRLAERPSLETALKRLRKREAISGTKPSTDKILRDRDADR